jgi:hypothetical protein
MEAYLSNPRSKKTARAFERRWYFPTEIIPAGKVDEEMSLFPYKEVSKIHRTRKEVRNG